MPEHRNSTKASAADQTGLPLNLNSLPPGANARWVARRKAQVVRAVQAGLLSLEEALSRYRLSIEEFTAWQRDFSRHGLAGLKITKAGRHRHLRTSAR